MKFNTILFQLSLVYFLIFQTIADAQNLIKNPSFEEYASCPEEENQLGFAKYWQSYFSTTDYYNLCGYYPSFIAQDASPRTGDAVVGARWLITTDPNPLREYIHGELAHPLESNQIYYFEFHTHLTRYSILIDQYSAHFSKLPITDIPPDGILYLDPHIQNQSGILSSLEWIRIGGCFTALGGEKYVTLGNFVSNINTDTLNPIPISGIPIQRHYTLIDDVSLFQINTLLPSDTALLEGESLSFNPNNLPIQYMLNGAALPNGQFQADSAGLFTIEAILEPCGSIGTFQVEVYRCEALAQDYQPSLRDTAVCLSDGWQAVFARTDTYNYRINGQLAAGNIFAPADTGQYEIVVELPDCIPVDTIRVEVLNCAPAEETPACFFIPNAFSPNGDGRNDHFQVYGSCPIQRIDAQVFDRWGSLVFSSTDPKFRWDGSAGGQPLGNGLYLYSIHLVFEGEDRAVYEVQEKGAVVLVR